MTLPTEVLEGGCVRQVTGGRGAFELLSPFVLERDAKLYEWGARPRDEGGRGLRNWEKGSPFSRCIQSMFRHMVKYMQNEPDEDHDDNLAAIRFWAAALMHYEEMIRRGLLPASLDDRPSYTQSPSGPLRIYVAGPISADNPTTRAENYRRGNEIGAQLAALGHNVFIPHRYEVAPEDVDAQTYEQLLRLDLSLIEKWAQAMFFIGHSPGADRELAQAKESKLLVFEKMSAVPDLWKKSGPSHQRGERQFP